MDSVKADRARATTRVALALAFLPVAATLAAGQGAASAELSAAAQAASDPALTLSLNQTTFRPGDALRVDVSVTNPGGGPLADFFLLVRLPDGSTTASIRLGAGPVFGSLANLRSLWPLAPGINLGGPFSVGQTVFQYGFNGSEPSGSYLVYFAALRSGALANGTLDAGEVLAVQTQSFLFTTEPGTPTVTIDQTAVLLPQVGATRQLTATALDGGGRPAPGPITWTSSKPNQVSVDDGGVVRALVANGSSQIVAYAGSAASAPLLVVATTTPAGATLLTDAEIIGDPVETDPTAAPSADNTYQVVLRGVAPPAIGALVINTGEKAVAGKVRAVSVAGTDVTVTLGLASLRELFPTLEIDEVIDLANAPVNVAPALSAGYNVSRSGNTFTFTPRPGAAVDQRALSQPNAALGTRALFPYACETDLGAAVQLSTPPIFTITASPTLDIRYTASGGLQHYLVRAEPTIKIEGGISMAAAVEGKISCKVELFVLRVPVGGPLSLVIGGLVPIGAGFELSGKLSVATLGIGTKVEAGATAAIGVECLPLAGCQFVKSIIRKPLKFTPTFDAPSVGDIRLEPSLSVFGTLEASIGNPFLSRFRLDAFKAKIGGKLAGSFAAPVSQIVDATYKSDYKLSFEASAGAGTDLDGVAKLLGISSITAAEFSISTDLARSPAPAAADPVVASQATFNAGDQVTFRVKLDPSTVEFLPVVGPYNVKTVVLVRGSTNPTIVGTVAAIPGDTEFTIPFVAPNFGTASEFSAFILTFLMPLQAFALEIGQAVGAGITVSPATASVATGATQTFTAAVTGLSSNQVVWSTDAGTITQAGVYTAPGTVGVFTVRATSAVNPAVFGEALVSVTSAAPVAVLTRVAQIGFFISGGGQEFGNNDRGSVVTFPTLTAGGAGGSATMSDTTAAVTATLNGGALDLVLSGRTTLTTSGTGGSAGSAAVDMRTEGSFQALQPLMCTFTVSVQKTNSNPNQTFNFLAVVDGPGGEKARLTAAGSASFACPPGLYRAQTASLPSASGGASASLNFTATLAVR